jgi:hypothetical protein
LTSMTTIAGLLPILSERSFQAQMVIPMAVSLCFGLSLATLLVLVLVPTFYSIYGRLMGEKLTDLSTERELADKSEILPGQIAGQGSYLQTGGS